MRKRIAIVITCIDSEKTIDSFIKYHSHIGFSHFFIFFDNPNDKAIIKASKYSDVTIIPKNDELKEKWKKSILYSKFEKVLDTEHMARQMLNVSTALRIALEKKIDWLLHIDIDELFYSPNKKLEEHFNELEYNNINSIRYLNFEALPEKIQINDYFKEVKLFKKNKLFLNSFNLIEPNNYFLAYTHGKSAVRVTEDLEPKGVHSFTTEQIYFKNLPIILHYYCCGYQQFVDKFNQIGLFAPKWFSRNEYYN